MNGIKKHKQVIIAIVALIVVTLVFLWPFFRQGFIQTDDADWMIIRLSAFYQSFREGQIPVRLLGRLNYSYGYPVANFLYPGFMYLGSVIHAAGVPFIQTIKLIMIGSIVTAVVTLLLWNMRFSSLKASIVGVLAFLLSPYIAFDLFQRGSVGELLAIAMISLSLYALESGKKHLFTISLALVILSHNSLALIALPFIFIYSLLRGKKYSILSFAFAFGMTVFFWFPALYERQFVRFDEIVISDPFQYFALNARWMLLSIPMILAAGYIFLRSKERFIIQCLSMSFIIVTILALPISGFLWQIDSFARLFQFPYRFLSLGVVIGTVLISRVFDTATKAQKILFLVILFAVSLPSLVHQYQSITPTDRPETFYTTNEATTTVANEYLPKWVSEQPTERAPTEIEFFSGKGSIELRESTTNKVVAVIDAKEQSVLQVNSIYYPGWGVLVDNIPVDISYDNPKGVVRFPVSQGVHTISTEFRETVPRFTATMISIVSVILFILAILVPDHIKRTLYREVSALFDPVHEEHIIIPKKQSKKRKKKQS
jgi:hypothetical protein